MVDAKTREEIIYKYLEEGQSIKELAREYDVTDVTINKWVKEYLDVFLINDGADLFLGLNEDQLRYKLIKIYRDKTNMEKCILINHYDLVSVLDLIVKSQETNQFVDCYVSVNERNLLDVFYDIEREKNRVMRIYILNNLPKPSNLKIDNRCFFTKMTDEIREMLNMSNYPFPSHRDKVVVSNIYKYLDDASIKKGYIDFNFKEDFVDKIIPRDNNNSRYKVSEKVKKTIRENALSSIKSLMDLSFIEYIVSEENGAVSYPRNKQFKSKLLFDEVEWINKSEGTMRIYLSRILREDWAMENYKKLIYEKGVENI